MKKMNMKWLSLVMVVVALMSVFAPMAFAETESIVEFIKAQVKGDIYDEQALEDMKRAAQKCDKSHDDEGDEDDTQESSSGFLHDRKFLNAVELCVKGGRLQVDHIAWNQNL